MNLLYDCQDTPPDSRMYECIVSSQNFKIHLIKISQSKRRLLLFDVNEKTGNAKLIG